MAFDQLVQEKAHENSADRKGKPPFAIPYSITKEMIDYIDDLIPNLKFHGHALTTKILLLHHNFSIHWEMVGGYYPEMIHPVYREIFNLCVDLWADFGDYDEVENRDVNKDHDEVDHKSS
ncbi:hypothetical protein EJD97_018643 [Solanum chilense]|uniref:Uncharacterized protein n=1 Tax=Solanum chilense TaxID=4083 RepID=A0A6N2CE65_SOLCI|nr:hypothetical protein EJD97_018643 [Solanum chilense]